MLACARCWALSRILHLPTRNVSLAGACTVKARHFVKDWGALARSTNVGWPTRSTAGSCLVTSPPTKPKLPSENLHSGDLNLALLEVFVCDAHWREIHGRERQKSICWGASYNGDATKAALGV